jgi:hypothetical protein
MADYVVAIVSCRRYAHKRRQQVATWCQTIPGSVPWFHVVGGLEGEGEGEWRYDAGERVLEVGCDDGYDSLPAKVYLMCAFVWSELRPRRGLIRVDDDTVVHVASLLGRAEWLWRATAPEQAVYAGTVWRADETSRPTRTAHAVTYCLGIANYLSRAALGHVVERGAWAFGMGTDGAAATDGQGPFSTCEDMCMGEALSGVALVVDLGTWWMSDDPTETRATVLYDTPPPHKWRHSATASKYAALYALWSGTRDRRLTLEEVLPLVDEPERRRRPRKRKRRRLG